MESQEFVRGPRGTCFQSLFIPKTVILGIVKDIRNVSPAVQSSAIITFTISP